MTMISRRPVTGLPAAAAPAPGAPPLPDSPLHNAETLTSGGITARIFLHDQIYTLRITRAGKLILTK